MKKYYDVYLDSIVSKSVIPLTEEEFYKSCESRCYDCSRTIGLKKIQDGIALCLWHRIKKFLFGFEE